jgi:hypothetical protein
MKDLLVKFEPYTLSNEEEKVARGNPERFIVQKLSRKKFRKQRLHPDTTRDITNKVSQSIKDSKPLHFVIPFGGYKHFWNLSHPYPDWSELFTLKFLTEWTASVLAVHKPGVIIEFISEGIILPRMDNYPDDTIEQYSKEFTALLGMYKRYVPDTIDIRFFRIEDRYDKKKIVEEVEKLLPQSWDKWNGYSEAEKVVELRRSKRSMFWNGKEDLTQLSEQEKEKRIIESRLIELAYYDIEARQEFLGDYFTRGNHIPICFSYGLSPDNTDHWITLGSTYASQVDYWIGRGILEERNNVFVNRIVSKDQYERIKNDLQLYKINFDLLPMGTYRSVEVISEQNWSSKLILWRSREPGV